MVYAQPRISPGKWDAQTSLWFWNANGSSNLCQTTWPCDSKKIKNKKKIKNRKKNRKKREPVDLRVKLKESEKKDKYVDLARELKKTMEHEIDGDTNCNWCAR